MSIERLKEVRGSMFVKSSWPKKSITKALNIDNYGGHALLTARPSMKAMVFWDACTRLGHRGSLYLDGRNPSDQGFLYAWFLLLILALMGPCVRQFRGFSYLKFFHFQLMSYECLNYDKSKWKPIANPYIRCRALIWLQIRRLARLPFLP